MLVKWYVDKMALRRVSMSPLTHSTPHHPPTWNKVLPLFASERERGRKEEKRREERDVKRGRERERKKETYNDI